MTDPILHLPLCVDERGSINDARGKSVADTWCLESEMPGATIKQRHSVGDASAAEIVRRVNLHDELVEALRKTIAALHRDRGYLPNCPVQLAAHTVLAKVEAKP